jgi:exosortase E/protease (VPEID-CTERM system)
LPSTEDPPIRLERLAFGKDNRHSGGAFLYPVIPYRILSITLLLAIELVAASLWLDTESLRHGGAFTRTVAYCAPWCVRASIAFAAALAIIGFIRFRDAATLVFPRIERAPISFILTAVHAAAVVTFCALAQLLFGGRQLAAGVSDLLTGGCLVACFLAVVSVVCAFVPLPLCLELIRSTRAAWGYAAAVSAAACLGGRISWSLWKPATNLTFRVVYLLLQPFQPAVVADSANMVIGTRQFQVEIAPSCSGLEGAGLMLIFGILWLWLFRRQCRFPQALLVIPVGISALWLLNAVRITMLILIGSAGAADIALKGFHSQAGWIAFNAVTLGLYVVFPKIPGITAVKPAPRSNVLPADNPAAAYLMPLLALFAAGMLSHALSGGFEWLYPLRFFAAAAALWTFRRKYAALDWRFGPAALLIGGAVFGIWLALDALTGIHSASTPPAELTALPLYSRAFWLTCRTAAAVLTVPIAEELAFRGFLLRRILSADFESVSPRRYTWLSLLASSVVFGVLHGPRWPAGIVAGLLYAAALLRRGRIGDAVAAHATTNALIAFLVLVRGDWGLW